MSRYLAIDPDAPGLFVLSGTVKKGLVEVEQAAIGSDELPFFSPATGGSLGTALKDLLKTTGIKPAPALVILGRDRVILKEVKYPPCTPEDEPALVRNQVIRELTDTADDVIMDYTPLTPAADGQRRAQVVFVRKDIILGVQAMCDAAGLRLAGITPRPFAATAAIKAAIKQGTTQPPANDVFAVATSSERGGEFTVMRGGEIGLTRSLSPYTNDAALASELKRNMIIYSGQAGAEPIDTLYIPEGGPMNATLAERLQENLPVMVEPFDLLKHGDLGDRIPTALHGRFTQLAGMLHLKSTSDILPINFTVPRQPKSEPGQGRIKVLLGVLAATVVLGAIGVFGYLQITSAEQRVQALKATSTQLEADLLRYEVDVKRLAAVDEFASREIVWLDELYDMAYRIPDVSKLSVIEVEGTAIVQVKEKPKPPTAPVVPGTATATSVAAAPNKLPVKAPPPPVATLRIIMRTADPNAAQFFVDGFNKDKYYVNTGRQYLGGESTSNSKQQQYVINTQILHRPPTEFLHRLNVKPPVKIVEAPKTEDANADPLGGF